MLYTQNFDFQFMDNNQLHKNITFNEAMTKLDHIINLSIMDFTNNYKESLQNNPDSMFIVNDPTDIDDKKLVYLNSGEYIFITPFQGMYIFIYHESKFYYYNNEMIWVLLNNDTIPPVPLCNNNINYINIEEEYTISIDKEYIYLYVQNDVIIHLNSTLPMTTLIIKQNADTKYNVKIHHLNPKKSIMLSIKQEDIAPNANSINIFHIYKLPDDYLTCNLIMKNASW